MFIKQYGYRSITYIKRYPKHYTGYLIFGLGFSCLAYLNKNNKNEIIRIGFAGSVAQFITEILFHPIDTINTRTKAEIAHKGMNSYKMILRIFDKENLFGFYRGASATYYGALIGGFIYFSTYKYLKNKLKEIEDKKSNENCNNHLHSMSYLISSLTGEFLFLVFYYPYDLIRSRQQTRLVGYRYKGPVDGIRQITNGKIRNIKKLYTGAAPSILLNLSNQSIMFTVLESMREYYLKKHNITSVNDLPKHIYFFCSIMAGVISGAATNIMEVVTIQKQIDPKFKFRTFIKEQGVKSLKQGLMARITINSCHSVSLFLIVDVVSNIFNVEL